MERFFKIFWCLLGVVAGLLLVRYHFLNIWQLWGLNAFVEGRVKLLDAMQSQTFWMMTGAAAVLGAFGWFVLGRFLRWPLPVKSQTQIEVSEDGEQA